MHLFLLIKISDTLNIKLLQQTVPTKLLDIHLKSE